jgi:hypothetical protein
VLLLQQVCYVTLASKAYVQGQKVLLIATICTSLRLHSYKSVEGLMSHIYDLTYTIRYVALQYTIYATITKVQLVQTDDAV